MREEEAAGFARVKPWREPGGFPSGGRGGIELQGEGKKKNNWVWTHGRVPQGHGDFGILQ